MSLEAVDLLLTDSCKKEPCPWCISVRKDEEEVPFKANGQKRVNWLRLIGLFPSLGINRVICSGGEPRKLGPKFYELINTAAQNNMYVTVSTAIFPQEGDELLTSMQQSKKILVGLPLDGSTPEMCGLMRGEGEGNRFASNLHGLKVLQGLDLLDRVTLRTVVARPNFSNVLEIPAMLLNNGIELFKLRWKLYQVNPLGVHKDEYDKWLIHTLDFMRIISRLKDIKEMGEITTLPVLAADRHHLIINSQGNANMVEMEGWLKEWPDIPSLRYRRLGNVNNEGMEQIIQRFRGIR